MKLSRSEPYGGGSGHDPPGVITLNGEGAITDEAGSVYVDENVPVRTQSMVVGVVLAAGEVDTTTPVLTR